MESAAEEILLRLPTRAIAVSRCVCKQWRAILTSRSFLDLHAHAAHVVSGAGAEALLISQTKDGGYSPVTKVLNASTGKNNHNPMCALVGLDGEYTPANACNGFLCLAATTDRSNPVFVCNPVTGDKVPVDPPPVGPDNWHMYAMGYSPSTRRYKLFGLSFSDSDNGVVDRPGYMYVLTLGAPAADVGGWRLHPGLLRCQGVRSPPALIDGRLYLLAKARKPDKKPDRLLV
ncbi:hypothetical protein ZWY2020_015201 [Hordeum vulgare]|nr:hypothetical protein ZWY2020_015201 [Hordeum vulgare]